jgi:hypothetical protein
MKTITAIIASLALAQLPITLARAVTDSDGALYTHAIKLMSESPLIDTHVDLPQIIRGLSSQFFGISLDSEI